jgi:replication factor C small subunit
MLWTEKYRPNRLSDLYGQEQFVMDAQSWKQESNMPNVLFYGNSGNGKTSAGIVLAKEILGDGFKENFFEINASDDRRLETVRTTIKQAAQSASLGDVPFRICLLDEMDNMTSDAQNALKRIMERYSSNIRFIITCNDKNKIIFALQSRCANYHFKPISNEKMLDMIKDILAKENVTRFSDEDLGGFLYTMNGDMRRAITEIQAAKSSNTTLKRQVEISLSEYNELLLKIINKNPNILGEIHDLLYQGKTIKEICNGLHDVVVNSEGIDTMLKFKLLRTVGETEWRSNTMTPKVLVSWMVGQLL